MTLPPQSTEESGATGRRLDRLWSLRQGIRFGGGVDDGGGIVVRGIVARKERGQGVKRIACELGVHRQTVRRWLRLGSCAAVVSSTPHTSSPETHNNLPSHHLGVHF